jgi:hypothetical protein
MLRRQSVSQSLLVSSPILSQDQIFVTVRQLRVGWGWVPSLIRGRVCRLQLTMVLANAVILVSESRGTYNLILLPRVRNSPKLEGQIPVFISSRNRAAQL